jgi:phasin family protein
MSWRAKRPARSPFDIDFAQFFADLKLPPMPDMGAFMAAQQRNTEALPQAYNATMQGGQEVARRHIEIMRQTMAELGETMRSIADPGVPGEKALKQAELAKRAYRQAVGNIRELSEMTWRANAEAVIVLNKRFIEAINEAKTPTEKPK